MNKACKNKKDNFFELIPHRNNAIDFEIDNCGLVTMIFHNKGVINKLAQLLFNQPPISYIHLDEIGSYIWVLMDGKSTVYDIAKLVNERFGKSVEPLYIRLTGYMYTLLKSGYISIGDD